MGNISALESVKKNLWYSLLDSGHSPLTQKPHKASFSDSALVSLSFCFTAWKDVYKRRRGACWTVEVKNNLSSFVLTQRYGRKLPLVKYWVFGRGEVGFLFQPQVKCWITALTDLCTHAFLVFVVFFCAFSLKRSRKIRRSWLRNILHFLDLVSRFDVQQRRFVKRIHYLHAISLNFLCSDIVE